MAPLQERTNTAPRRSSLLSNYSNSNSTPQKHATSASQSPVLNRNHSNKHGKIAVLAAANRLREAGGAPTTPNGTRNFSGQLMMNNEGRSVVAPLVVESQRYEEWMKIATDNKITSTNTWSLALIDYFADMSLLRNGDDNSINFQKASCTLDGCVKIWTSRVDSVVTETGKLLSGLAEDGRGQAGGDDDEDVDNDEDEEAREARKAKRKNAKKAETLADSFSKIKVKAFDLEFTVDPLFSKTSADFDEGGASGILMNHLGCDANMKVVFDAGDAKLDRDDEDDDDDDVDDEEEADENEDQVVDLTRLATRCFPEGLSPFNEMVLCPSLASFRFSPDANLDLGFLQAPTQDDDEFNLAQLRTQRALTASAAPALLNGGQNVNDGFGDDFEREYGGGFDNDDEGGGGGAPYEAVDFFADEPLGGGMGGERGDSPEDENEVMMSMEGGGPGEKFFDMLDAGLSKNWAGPEHWKMRRVAQRKVDDDSSAPKQRKEKVAFAFDFSVPPLITQKELFAPASTAASIRSARKSTLAPRRSSVKRSSRAAVAQGSEEDQHILPDDYHFNSQVLLRLFLKPKLTLKLRRRGTGAAVIPLGGGEADAQYWANAGAFEPGQDMGGHEPDFDQSFGGDDYAVPFDTQILNDGDDDLPYFNEDDDDSPTGPSLDDLTSGTNDLESDNIFEETQGQLKRVRPENINYAKRAKRVDVAKLKDSIWSELQVVSIPVKEFPSEPVYKLELSNAEETSLTASSKPETLVPVVDRLRKTYPKDKMDEISTSFCFICLLHLANEKGLRIQTPGMVAEDDEEEEIDEGMRMRKNVGGLEGLRVFRTVEE